jgi:hypothetical protein
MVMIIRLPIALLWFTCLAGVAPAESYEVRPSKAMKLPPGYTLKQETGIATIVGTISKEGGVTIRFDIGPCLEVKAT